MEDVIQHYAERGASMRLQELKAEMAAIFRTFPGIEGGQEGASGARKGKLPANGASHHAAPSGAPGGSGARSRPSMSAAQKKEVSARMKRYWAARRAEKKAGAK